MLHTTSLNHSTLIVFIKVLFSLSNVPFNGKRLLSKILVLVGSLIESLCINTNSYEILIRCVIQLYLPIILFIWYVRTHPLKGNTKYEKVSVN